MEIDEDELLVSSLGIGNDRSARILAPGARAVAKKIRKNVLELDIQLIGSPQDGHLNLNRAVVTVTIRPADGGGSRLIVRGAAKEGLIKQRSGEEAARRVAAAIG